MAYLSFYSRYNMLKFRILFAFMLAATWAVAQTASPCTTTEHGYRFCPHISKGGQKPRRGETIKAYVHIFIGDTLLSSSRKNLGGTYKYELPAPNLTLDHYPPIMDACLLMGLGDSATIYQPVDTNMRKFLPKGVQNEKELRFEIVLAQIITAEEKARAEQAFKERAAAIRSNTQNTVKDYAAGKLDGQLTVLPSGLKMKVLENGPGKPVRPNDLVQVHYYGFTINGNSFDNSFDRHQPIAFPVGVGQMIPGFDEGVLTLTHGSKAYLFIPSKLGYGDQEAAEGAIPANSELIFYIEVL